MPILIYSRPPLEDEYFSLSNNLVIQDNQLAKDLLVGAGVKFYSESKLLLDGIFSNKFSTLVFQINDEETIYTAQTNYPHEKVCFLFIIPNIKTPHQL